MYSPQRLQQFIGLQEFATGIIVIHRPQIFTTETILNQSHQSSQKSLRGAMLTLQYWDSYPLHSMVKHEQTNGKPVLFL